MRINEVKFENKINDLVSVIVPIYNKETELKRCIDSIRFQDYENVEIILVDDGSVDGSLNVCEDYRNIDGRIKVIHKENGGVSTARNAGITVSNGTWIMFVDPDDMVAPGIITELIKYDNLGAQVIAGCLTVCDSSREFHIDSTESDRDSGKLSFYDGDILFCDDFCEQERFIYKTKKDLYLEILNENYGASECRVIGMGALHAKLYNREFINNKGLRFFDGLIRMQDNVFNMCVFREASKVIYIDKPLYYYDVCHKKGFQRRFDENAKNYYDKVLRYRYKFLTEKDMLKGEYYDEFCAGVVEVTSAILKHEFLSPSNPKEVSEIIKDMKCFFGDELYQRAFHNRHMGRVRPVMKLRAILLRYEAYRCLIWLERIIYIIKRVRV